MSKKAPLPADIISPQWKVASFVISIFNTPIHFNKRY